MSLSRRSLLTGVGALAAAAVITPEQAFAAAANSGDWTIAFEDVEKDIEPAAMRLVHGRPPAGLRGVLYRNGPAKFRRPGGSATHWFDGDGMVRRFAIEDGRAVLSARFADTPKRRVESEAGAMLIGGFGTPAAPRARVMSNDDANAANTSVLARGGKLWALWEGGSAWAMDPASLESLGPVTLRPDLKAMPFSAHPRYEPDGRVWNFGLWGKRAIIWRLSPTAELEAAEVLDLDRASYFHDFTATERHIILVLQPWVREGNGASYAESLRWRPELGTRVLVLDKADLTQRRVFELPAFSYFHLGDAWEERDGTIRFDVCAYQNPEFGLEGARGLLLGKLDRSPPGVLAQIALGPDGAGRYAPSSAVAEFPKSDPRFAGRPRSLTFHVGGERDRTGLTPLSNILASTNLRTGVMDAHDFGLRHLVEEPIFVPRPGSDREGDGWLLATSINLDAKATDLHVLDASRISAGPLATWRAPTVMPATFHGAFVQGGAK